MCKVTIHVSSFDAFHNELQCKMTTLKSTLMTWWQTEWHCWELCLVWLSFQSLHNVKKLEIYERMWLTEYSMRLKRKTLHLYFKTAVYNKSYVFCTTSFVHCSINHSKGHAIAQVISFQPLTTETWVCDHVTPCGICGGKNGTGKYLW